MEALTKGTGQGSDVHGKLGLVINWRTFLVKTAK